MRRAAFSGWSCAGAAAATALAVFIAAGARPAAAMAPETEATAQRESLSPALAQLFSGGVPRGLADLRAMQTHVHQLTDQLTKCTVGVQVGGAWGSGVIISKDGYVLTAAHVAGRPNRVRQVSVKLADGREVSGRTLGLFRTLDAGLMKITTPGEYPFAEMGDSTKLRDGQWCVAMGHPGGYQPERGAVLRLGRITFLGNDAITTDCTLVGGDSGGPLFDMDGRVIGINSRIAGSLAANMHVPVSAYKSAWDRLANGEAWGHLPGHEPYFGVTRKSPETAEIASVRPKSPAEQAGILPGDVVLNFDGKAIARFDALIDAVAECQPGDEVNAQIRRGEQTLDIKIKLGKKE